MAEDLQADVGSRYLRFDKYEVLAHLATGGMGAVYKARDVNLRREVALKVLSPECSSDPARMERFRREARHSAKVRHENIVTLFEFGESNGIYFLALEFIDGIDLHEYIDQKGRLDPDEAKLILVQAARALDHAHSHGLVHRDIKPSNILLTQRDKKPFAKLTDFGLARGATEQEMRVTMAGHTVGTVDYMSPEQARDSNSADIRSDLYSLGCTFYHMLAGQPPFAEGSLTERVLKHCEIEPPDILQFNDQISPHLVAVLAKLLAKDPAERYQTPAELLNDLLNPTSAVTAPPSLGRTPFPKRGEGKGEKPAVSQPSARPVTAENRAARRAEQETKVESSPFVVISPDQRKAAAGQYERAKEVIAGGNEAYAIQLLLSCCKLDPANLEYRRGLRRLERKVAQESRGISRLAWLSTLPSKTKLKAAKRSKDYRKVLEHGEEVLARNYRDLGTLLDMAQAADGLELYRLAIWLLQQAHKAAPTNVDVLRTLARLYEKAGVFEQAIALWDAVRKADPRDFEAHRKVTQLSASETIARGGYEDMPADPLEPADED